MISREGDAHEMQSGKMNHVDEVVFQGLDQNDADMKDIKEFEQHRKDYMDIIRELRKKHPNADMKQLEEMAELEAFCQQHMQSQLSKGKKPMSKQLPIHQLLL
jgi:solute carrier family 8 (sodium/calcium exchanger)